MNEPITIRLPDERADSWNNYWSTNKHWAQRAERGRAIHALVRAALDPDAALYSVPVAITVVAEYKRNPVDCSNVCGKSFEDALKGRLIVNDSPKYVRSFTTISRKGETDSVTIHLEPVEGASHDA